MRAAVELVAVEAVSLVVATAAADIGNLRFYQRQGFRMRAIERDAVVPGTGYPAGIVIDGIELRDRRGGCADHPGPRAACRRQLDLRHVGSLLARW